MLIRDYSPADEQDWLRCRVAAFLDCSYWNDVKTTKETYAHPSVSLVAEENGRLVGLIDLELDSDDLCNTDHGRGAVLWHLAVLPEYRRQGVAARLWQEAEKRLLAEGVRWCELWTQEDEAANRFYQAMGFTLQPESTWLRCYARWDDAYSLLNIEKTGPIYGAEEVVFQAAPGRREELQAICYRIDEVRLYAKALTELELYIPRLDELGFRQQMMADPDIMSYNANWDVSYAGYHRETGCIDFPEEDWADWYDYFINREPERYFAYIRRKTDGAWLGEVSFHYTPDEDWWDMGIVIHAPYRGKGYAVPALKLLLRHAFEDCGVTRIHNDFEIARNEQAAWKTHLAAGFHETGDVDGFKQMIITKQDYLQLPL